MISNLAEQRQQSPCELSLRSSGGGRTRRKATGLVPRYDSWLLKPGAGLEGVEFVSIFKM